MRKRLLIFILLIASAGFAAGQKSISGLVSDESRVPIPGVSIIVKGTTTGTVTDLDGKFSLMIPATAKTLVFSFIGMKPVEVQVAGSNYNITMQADVIGLEEVIAVGYGTMRKSDLTGSVVRVSMEDKPLQGNLNVLNALQGVTAGVNVQAAGLAGSEPDLSIRGKTSLSASDRPLIVLDGIIYNGNTNDINLSDIESIDILKDASAAAVYGSRSANGVMLITTKKGKAEKPTITFNMYYGFQDMTNNPMKVMDAEQYAIRLVDYYYQQSLYQWYYKKPTSSAGKPVRRDITNKDLVAGRLRTQEEKNNYLAGKSINWVDEVLQVAPIQNYNISYSGRSKNTNYFVSASYTNEEGIQKNDQFSRLTLNTKVESELTKWLTIGANASYSYLDYSGIPASLADARTASPLANNYIGMPTYDKYLTGEAYMIYPLIGPFITNSDIRNNLFMVGNAKITVPWVKGLTFNLDYSNRYYTRDNNTFWPVNTPDGAGNKGRAVKQPYSERNSLMNNILAYSRGFGEHQINATVLFSREKRFAQSSELTAEGFDNPVLGYNNMSLGTIARVTSGAWEENSLSYMARAMYGYKNRYLVTATVRRDGFSGFSEKNKFATFPSVSLGWVMSDESFMKNTGVYLKLRTSYGQNGNQGIGRYSSFSRMSQTAYTYGGATAVGIYPNSLGNADLSWETTTSLNLGFDYAFLKQRISGSVDLYSATTEDVLVQRALPPATGYTSVWTNLGAIENKGIEFELRTINIQKKDLNWNTGFIFSLNRDKITKLYGNNTDKDIGNSWFVGEPISAIYDYEMAGGLWTEEDLYGGKIMEKWWPGQFKYVDQNTDGQIEPNNDRKIIGYRTPSYRFSITNTVSYKNFTLSFFINSVQGGKKYFLENNAEVLNVRWNADDVYRINASAVRPYWTPDNGVNNATGVYNTPVVSSGIYQSRSFVRLQDISLSYKVGKNILNKLKMEGLSFYLASRNPYTWTKWSGWDPETGTSNNPAMRNVTAGFRLTL